jgi:drug/metabolite transporter (DMT)-like permease
MKIKDIGAMFGLAALWGASFLFIRIASPVLGPFLTIQGRVTIAGIALLLYIWLTKQSADFRRWWKQYLIIGALNAAIPFTLIATAELRLNASMGAILNSLTPLFTAIVSWGWMKEKLTIRKWLGILTGIVGVVILVGWSPMPFTKEVLISIGSSILSTVSYGFAGVYAKKAFTGVPPLSLAAGQQMGASVLLLPLTLIYLPSSITAVSSIVILSVLGLALLCTAIAYLLYFYLIASVGPTKTLSVTFLIPLFGMIWGVLFLHENIAGSMILGLAVILSSVFMISDIPVQSVIKKKKKLVG